MDATTVERSTFMGSPSKLGSVKFDDKSIWSSPTKFGGGSPLRKQ